MTHEKERKGSITFEHKRGDIIENTIGRLGALRGNIMLWTPEAILHNISKEQEEELKERYNNVNWRGDVKVYLNHNPLFDQLKRQFFEPGNRRVNFFLRVPGVLATFGGWISSKLHRADYYNPFTETVTTYNPNLAVAYHEIGHAEYFDKLDYPGLVTFLSIIPGLRSFVEWSASHNAMKHLNHEERQKVRKVLEPALGTYIGPDAALATAAAFPDLIPIVAPIYPISHLLGLVAGHIHSRLPGSRNIFFDETAVDDLPSLQPSIQPHLQPALVLSPAH